MKLLKKNNMEVVEFLAEKMMKFKRQTKSIGVCKSTNASPDIKNQENRSMSP